MTALHIALHAPSVAEHVYVNRKNFHSLNVQIICDAHMQLCSKWPGSTQDSFILRHSRVGLRLEAGDRGYQLKAWLLTPSAEPRTTEEMCYNLAHGRTRSVVEGTIGLLKGSRRCLAASGGKLLYKPEKVTRIILACGMLHNIALRHGIEMDAEIRMDPQEPPNPPPNGAPAPADAVRRRRQLMLRLVD
ncbi:putative nuclease HARBI1 [Salvelinus fontinalis]|uniref:putative nuclease HARBI1 n=1 Tax=Salvelinus fontinalis TaxID=8038 RepID=UPI0024860288|nr:putative nuclease HARBI1 [Salvelinus fontinalis]